MKVNGFGAILMGAMVATAPIPSISVAHAQDSRWSGRDHGRWDRGDDWPRHRARERRKDARTKGIVTGVLATAAVGGVIAAVASSDKKDDRTRYCLGRYGNYDRSSDTYRASDGRSYPCE